MRKLQKMGAKGVMGAKHVNPVRRDINIQVFITKGDFAMEKRICCKELSMEAGKKGCCVEDETLYNQLYDTPSEPKSKLREIDREVLAALANISAILHEVLSKTDICCLEHEEESQIQNNDKRLMYLDQCLNSIRNS